MPETGNGIYLEKRDCWHGVALDLEGNEERVALGVAVLVDAIKELGSGAAAWLQWRRRVVPVLDPTQLIKYSLI